MKKLLMSRRPIEQVPIGLILAVGSYWLPTHRYTYSCIIGSRISIRIPIDTIVPVRYLYIGSIF